MKASPNEDFYILMSTIVDAPIFLGTMEQTHEANNDTQWKADCKFTSDVDLVEMAHQADEFGSSSWSGNGIWDAKTVILSNIGNFSTNTEYWELPRGSVSDFFKAYLVDYGNKDYEESLLNQYCTPMPL